MARARLPGEWPPVTAQVRPSDYVADDVGTGTPGEPDFVPGADADRRACRGAIEFHPRWKNYSYHRVLLDTGNQNRIVRDCNFTLSRILVTGTGNVEFRDCNFVRSRWRSQDGAVLTFVRCNTFRGQGE